MIKDISEIVQCLYSGQASATNLLIEDLRKRSLFLDDQIQQDVLMFIEQLEFQKLYDSSLIFTKNIQLAADKLIEDLGFHIEQAD